MRMPKCYPLLGAAAYQLGNTSSRTITEVKQRWARLVLGWETVQLFKCLPCTHVVGASQKTLQNETENMRRQVH